MWFCVATTSIKVHFLTCAAEAICSAQVISGIVLFTVIQPCHATSIVPNIPAMSAETYSISYISWLRLSQACTKWTCCKKKKKKEYSVEGFFPFYTLQDCFLSAPSPLDIHEYAAGNRVTLPTEVDQRNSSNRDPELVETLCKTILRVQS